MSLNVIDAIASAYKDVQARGLRPYRLTLHPKGHERLIEEMGEEPGSQLLVVAGMDVVLDLNCEEYDVYVNGRGS